jgi:histidinol dehydrogenase
LRRLLLDTALTAQSVRKAIPRAESIDSEVTNIVSDIISDVRKNGAQALLSQAEKFDGVAPKSLRVSESDLNQALEWLPADLKLSIEEAIMRVRKVSERGLVKDFSVDLGEGATVLQRYVPVDSVGLYVPGGKAVYPSSVIMNAVAAQVANVPRIVICTPAQKEFGGLPHPSILATAKLLGVTEVYAIGGAGAVAALAYGVPEIGLEPVTMVTGPGNIFVATAKRLLRGVIGIDSEAGPTEILILADEGANPAFIAADLISQAEHDENAAAVLVTDSSLLLDEVESELAIQVSKTKNRVRVETALSGQQSALVLVPNFEAAIKLANLYATEHLEIHCKDNESMLGRITNAGAIFLGDYSPVSLGDYLAGSNHVLPTSEQAKFGPGLGVHTFLRPQQVISYSKKGLADVVAKLDVFARAEGLEAHGDAGTIRFSKEK